MTKSLEFPSGIGTNFRLIPVGDSNFAIVDPEDYPGLCKFKWRLVQANYGKYAKTTITKNGKQIGISMHRFVNKTPFGLVCHHVNSRTLDNRKKNLWNMDKSGHTQLHRNNSLMIKYSAYPTGQGQAKL